MPHTPHDTPVLQSTVDNAGIVRSVVVHARVAAQLIAGTDKFNAEKVHAFVATALQYDPDLDPRNQRLRMPWRSVSEGVVDCKSSAILIAALAQSAGKHVSLAFIDQTGNGWDHVFAVVEGEIIDPLCPFGTTFQHFERYDVPL